MARQLQIDPEALGLVARMELIARRAVEGFLSGLHPSPYFGSSVEYADHRPYSVGDEIRRIDWKLAAKTDKHYVKLFEEQTNTRCTILLDASRSMGYAGPGQERPKIDYARHLAAAMGYLMVHQHDAVGLCVCDATVREFLPARATARHYRRMLEELAAVGADRRTSIGGVLRDLAGRLPRRGIVVLISDMIDDPESIASGLGLLRHERNDVIVLQVMDRTELSFPFDRLTRFKDIEGSGMLVASGRSIRDAYLERLHHHLDTVRRICMERDVAHEVMVTDRRYDQALSAYLAKRERMTG